MANDNPIPFISVLIQAYRLAGVLLAPGRGLNGSEQQEGLDVTNALIDGLKAERCFVFQVVRTLFNVKSGQQDYLVGTVASGAALGFTPDWDIERPEKLLGAGFIVQSSAPSLLSEIKMDLLISWTQWQSIITKNVQTSQPRVMYYRPTLPAGTASIWPVPTVDSQIVLYTPGWVDEFASVDDIVMFPKGYREMLEYNIAVAVHDRYPTKIMAPSVEQRAVYWKSRVMANQFMPALIRSDDAAMQEKPGDNRRWYDARTWPGGF